MASSSRTVTLMRPRRRKKTAQKLKAKTCKVGRYEGKEKCLIASEGKFPVTKNNRIACKRVRNVMARAKQYGYVKKVLRAGFCAYADKCGINSKYC